MLPFQRESVFWKYNKKKIKTAKIMMCPRNWQIKFLWKHRRLYEVRHKSVSRHITNEKCWNINMGPWGLNTSLFYSLGKEAWKNKSRTDSPILRSLAQLSNRNGKFARSVRFQKFLQSHKPLVVLVDNGETLPAPSFHQIDVRLEHG